MTRETSEWTSTIDDFVSLVKQVERDPLQFDDTSRAFLDNLEGMSGLKFRILISELTSRMPKELSYLELGIFQGVTSLAVARHNPTIKVVGVDNFSQFDPRGANLKKINSVVEKYKIRNFEFYDWDFENFLIEDPAVLRGSVGVYFFDASHDYRSQILALMHAPKWLAAGGIIIVDDCNYPHVRQATVDFLHTHPDYKLLCEFYTGLHPNYRSMSRPKSKSDRIIQKVQNSIGIRPLKSKIDKDEQHMHMCKNSWWNGVNIIVHDPLDALLPIYPNVPVNLRGKFLKQHGFAGCNAEDSISQVAEMR